MRLRGLRVGALGLLAACPLLVSACGEDDFENEPRPPTPIALTAAIDSESVNIAPNEFGAGIVDITISNQTDEPTRLILEGPTSTASRELTPGGTGTLKTTLEEGVYEVAANDGEGIRPARLEVGPERPTSQNELLKP